MLKNISWSAYFTFIIIVLVVYYLIICLKYYKTEIKNILTSAGGPSQRRDFKRQDSVSSNRQTTFNKEQLGEDNFFPVVNQFTEEIKYSLEQAAASNLVKEELLYSLQQLAKKYFQIKSSPFQSFITNYILVESSNYSSIHLSEEDLNVLWVM